MVATQIPLVPLPHNESVGFLGNYTQLLGDFPNDKLYNRPKRWKSKTLSYVIPRRQGSWLHQNNSLIFFGWEANFKRNRTCKGTKKQQCIIWRLSHFYTPYKLLFFFCFRSSKWTQHFKFYCMVQNYFWWVPPNVITYLISTYGYFGLK